MRLLRRGRRWPPRRWRAAGALLLLVTIGVVVGRVWWSNEEAPIAPPPPLVDLIYRGCETDPAALPVPIGPDGRPANYLHTCGDRLYDARGQEVRITGLNWFGMETTTYAPHGLWSRNWQSLLDQIAALGYNAIRLPYSNQLLEPGRQPSGIDANLNPDLVGLSGAQILDKMIAGARERGLRVILDRHRPTADAQSDLWYTRAVPESRWIQDWVTLARRYRGNDTVVGVDLHNEPKGAATWGDGNPATDWRLAAQRAGNAILAVNPNLLIIVEGVERQDNDWYWWGGNLEGVAQATVELQVPNRVVYSPHDYGPGVYRQGWFSASNFPANLPRVWDTHWGFIKRERLAPVVLGEFGGASVGNDADGAWQRTLVQYLTDRHLGFFVWSLNPDSSDTGGLLADDWMTVVAGRQSLYRTALAPPIPRGDGGVGADPAKVNAVRLQVLYQARVASETTNTISFAVQIQNNGHGPIDLHRLELRYWISPDDFADVTPVDVIDWAAVGTQRVHGEIVPSDQASYLRLTFDLGAAPLQPYGTRSGDILVRLYRPDWKDFTQTADYSFDAVATAYRPAPRITLYLDGKLIWGKEPTSGGAGA